MPDSRPPHATWLVRFLILLTAYYVGGRIGLTVPYVGSHISLIWPPTGIALAALLRWELSLWPAIWLGALGVNLAVGSSPLLAAGIACGNTLGPWLAARVLRSRKFDPGLPRRHDLLLYLGIAVLACMAINATNGVIQLWLADILPTPAIGSAWVTWWLGDAMGALVMGIPLLTSSRDGWHALYFGRRGSELVALMTLTLSVGAWVFEGHAASMPANPLLYLPFFLLSWLAIRGGANIASTGALLLSAEAVWVTANGSGPFQSQDIHYSLAMLWGYMATATVITVLITVLVDELRVSERRLMLATVGGQLGLWEWNMVGDQVSYTGDVRAALGLNLELPGSNQAEWMARIHPDDRASVERSLSAHLTGNAELFEAEYRLLDGDHTAWVQARGQVVERDSRGQPVRMAGTLLNVTDRKRTEEAFAKESHKKEALLHAASDGIHVLDKAGRIVEVSDSFCEMLGYARNELLGVHVSQWDAQWTAEELDTRRMQLQHERSTFETLHRRRDGHILDVEISTIGVVIDGELLLYCSARDITRRKRAEHDMRESRTRMRALLDACDESVMLLTPDGRILAINAFGAQRLGRLPDEMVGQDFFALIPPDLAVSRRAVVREAVTTAGPVHLQDQREGIFFDISLYPVIDESGKVESIAVYAKDVTERRAAEEALRRSEERWKFALEGAEAGVYDWNVQTDEVFFSARAQEVLGFSANEQILTLPQWESRLHPLDMPRRRHALHEHLDGRKPLYVCEYRYRTATRGWKWILARGIVAERTADGKPLRMIGTLIDIDAQRRNAKADALRSRALEMLAQGGELKSIFDTVLIGLEEEDPSFGFAVLLRNDDGQLSIGSAPGLLFTAWSEKQALSGTISAGGTVAVLGDPLEVELPDAAYRHSLALIAEAADVKFCWSEPLMLGPEKTGGALLAFRRETEEAHFPRIETLQHTAQLISIALQRKHTDAQLQLASSVYEASGEAIMVVDGDNRIIAVNPSFTQLTGYAALEVLGRNPRLLRSGRNDDAFYQRMWQALNQTGQWQGEMWNRRKDGEEIAEWLTINTIHDTQGKVLRRVAIFSDITEKKRSEDIIWRQANYDALTALPNRRLFRDRLDQEVDKASRNSGNAQLALLFIDLDRFKDVNDTLGHEVGDRLLVEAAQRICACVRSSDTVARLGGDEFTVILPAMEEISRIEQVAQAIIRTLATPFRLGAGEPVYVSASIGITLFPGDAEDSQTLLKTADQAMYAAKNQGRNRFSYFTQSLQDAAQSRLQINNDLWFALAGQQFEVYYQPILDLASGDIIEAEALLRWRHPERGMISPAEFIPLAEENGLINDIGDWVFRQAALAASRWRELLQRDIKVSVNKSPRQFQAGSTQELWPRFLNEIGLPPECLVIEITEGLLLDNRPEVAEKLLAFRDAGIEIALDDFGTGYSAMPYLKKFHIDYLKIDQSFVRDMGHDPADRAIAEAIIVMAHKLGLKVVAEGVETAEQRDLLATAGCDYGQGYLFARPLPAAEFEALLARHKPLCQEQAPSPMASETPEII